MMSFFNFDDNDNPQSNNEELPDEANYTSIDIEFTDPAEAIQNYYESLATSRNTQEAMRLLASMWHLAYKEGYKEAIFDSVSENVALLNEIEHGNTDFSSGNE